jgi:hypothetical protein
MRFGLSEAHWQRDGPGLPARARAGTGRRLAPGLLAPSSGTPGAPRSRYDWAQFG